MATVQGVYVALFGRPADPAGLAYFNGVTNNGANLSAISNLAGQPEFTARFAGQSNLQIITSIYQSLFNRAPEAAGLEFFAGELNAGRLNINNIAIAILDGAKNDDKLTVTNKLAAADRFTASLDTATEQAAYTGAASQQAGRNFLNGVTKDPVTVPTQAATDVAVKAVVDAGAGTVVTPGAGVSISIVAATDVVSTNAANPAFKSTNADDTINVANGGYIKGTSNYNAGLGNDVLKISGATAVVASAAGDTPTIAGVETISTTNTAAVGLNLSKTTGLTTFEVDGSTAAVVGAVTVVDAAAGVTLSVKGAIGSDVSFGIKDAATGLADALTIKASGVSGAGDLIANGVETLTVELTGSNTIDALTSDALKTLNVTGAGNGVFTAVTDTAQFKTVDASAASGNLTMTVGDAGVKYTGSKGIDTVTLGAGTDTVVFNTANVATINKADSILAFTTGTDKINLAAFASTADGSKLAVDTFTGIPAQGETFVNAVAVREVTAGALYAVYVDVNGNQQFDVTTDLSFTVAATGVTAADFVWA